MPRQYVRLGVSHAFVINFPAHVSRKIQTRLHHLWYKNKSASSFNNKVNKCDTVNNNNNNNGSIVVAHLLSISLIDECIYYSVLIDIYSYN